MQPRSDKIVEAILYVIVEAKNRGDLVDQYEIVKTIFLADRQHLNRYGRPITFDNYFAMKDGPVPSLSYDLLKEDAYALRDVGGYVPWVRQHRIANIYDFVEPARAPSDEVLSPSDKRALADALAVVKSLGFNKTKKITHDDPAYKSAWGDGANASSPMEYALLFDPPDKDLAAELEYLSQQA